MKRVHNWLPYNETILQTCSDSFFKEAGKSAFTAEGKSQKDIVPNAMTNSIAHARSFAQFVKKNIELNPSNEKFKILEVGSGSGIFAKNFLICAREMNFLDQIEYLITDYSRAGLNHLKESEILKDFQENINYRFVHLDILNPEQAQDLQGNSYKIENLSASILNYILCVLPTTIVRQSKQERLQQLLLRIKEKCTMEESSGYLNELIYEEQWKGYFIKDEPEMEQKYHDILIQSLKNNPQAPYEYYPYASLQALDNILERSCDNALIFIAEMPKSKNSRGFYSVYGKTIAHPINLNIINDFVQSKQLKSISAIDPYYPLARTLILKNTSQELSFREIFIHEYIENNDSNTILELRKMLWSFKSKHSISLMKSLVEKFRLLDNYSYETKLILAVYYCLNDDLEQARLAYQEAQKLDHLNSIEFHASHLKKILESKYERI